MSKHQATPEQWKNVEDRAVIACVSTDSCLLELRARAEALEAQADHIPDVRKMVPPPVATDKELIKIWDKTNGNIYTKMRAIYSLGIEHGQPGSRKVAEPAPAEGDLEIAVLVTDLSRIANDAAAACQSDDAKILNRAASLLNQLGEQLPEKDGVPAPMAGGLVERVTLAIDRAPFDEDDHQWHEARAAILEVARWLREHGWKEAADLLEREAGR